MLSLKREKTQKEAKKLESRGRGRPPALLSPSVAWPVQGRTDLRPSGFECSVKGQSKADEESKEGWLTSRQLSLDLLDPPAEPGDLAMLPERVSQPQRTTMPQERAIQPDTGHVTRGAHFPPQG